MRLCVDDTKCVGIGLCEARLPEQIAVSDDGFAVVAPGEIPEALLPAAEEAVANCPSGARAWRTESKPKEITMPDTPTTRPFDDLDISSVEFWGKPPQVGTRPSKPYGKRAGSPGIRLWKPNRIRLSRRASGRSPSTPSW